MAPLTSDGAQPLCTPGYNLPAGAVLHVAGPQLAKGAVPTPEQRDALARCYTSCLNAAIAAGLRSIAFPCISAGLFCFPQDAAAEVATAAVLGWLGPGQSEERPALTALFCVFSDTDEALYRSALSSAAAGHRPLLVLARSPPSSADRATAAAQRLFRAARRVLICAGAGMSITAPEALQNVYVDPRAFAAHYPVLAGRYGYRTAYECMGLRGDGAVPEGVKWGFHAAHWHNMRWGFPPGPAYGALLAALMAGGKDYFVHTSNVDGAFVRAGFDTERVYTVQGDFSLYQCLRPCARDAVFESGPLVEGLRSQTDAATGAVPPAAVPHCPKCGGEVFANVRGGDWFLPTRHAAAAGRLLRWLEAGAGPGAPPTLILEVGAGFNTPTVTRLPMEALVRQEPAFTLLRVNPDADQAAVPADLERAGKALSVARGNDAVAEIVGVVAAAAGGGKEEGGEAAAAAAASSAALAVRRGDVPWRAFFANLVSFSGRA